MPTPILSTKLYIPPPRQDLLPRPRLIEQLNRCLSCKLTLISAPAGFGKSTLLSQWVSAIKHPIGWLSLDSNDDDPFRFITYLIGALQKIDLNVGQEALEILHSARAPAYEAILTLLLNEVSGTSEHFTLILDDYHFITDEQVHEIISFMVDNMPHSMHLVISTRLDPRFPLARMRARRELVEIRSKDLRLVPEETVGLLNGVNGLNLSLDEIQLLDERVEGWLAGLQMAILSMQGRKDVFKFIKTFTGSNRFILDYLMEEVLNKQSPEIKDFLLRTSILDRMNASLCNTIMDKNDSQKILTQLELSNTFLIPLDNERTWYRYHHLFSDLLQKRLVKFHSSQISNLHIRASIWYDSDGLFTEAISHALNGEDFDRAANLYEKYGLKVMNLSHDKNLSSWLDLLPFEVIRNRPWLCILQAWLHYSVGTRAKAEEFLQIAEQAIMRNTSGLQMPPPPQSLSVVEQQRIRGAIASIRAHISIVERDFQTVLEQAKLAFDNLSDEDSWQITAMVALGCAYWALGDRHQSEKTFASASAAFLQKGNWDGVVSSLCYMGIMQFKHGHLQSSLDTYTEALNRATRPDGGRILFASIPFLRIGDLMREWNDLDHAQEFIDKGIALAAKLNHPDVLIEAYICLARLQFARKNQAKTFSALKDADRIMANNEVDPWYLGWLTDCWVSYWLSTGDLNAAVSQVESSGLTIDGPLSFHHDLHHISLARVLIVQGVQDPPGPYLDQAGKLLYRLQEAAEKADWIHETIRILILKSFMLWASRKKERSVEVLIRALILAEPGGYVRMFTDEGAPMEELLGQILQAKQITGKSVEQRIRTYVEKLMGILKNEKQGKSDIVSKRPSYLKEPLSKRELEVLQLLNSHLSSVEIADELMVSPNTIRFHIKNIYSKFDVHNRSAVVQKAKDLMLL